VVGCLAKGMANSQIAKELSVSIHSVFSHVRNMLGNCKWQTAARRLRFMCSKIFGHYCDASVH